MRCRYCDDVMTDDTLVYHMGQACVKRLRARLMVVEAEHERLEVEATYHRIEAADARAQLVRAEADTVKAVEIGYRDGYEAGWGAASKHGAGYTYATADAAWQASKAKARLT